MSLLGLFPTEMLTSLTFYNLTCVGLMYAVEYWHKEVAMVFELVFPWLHDAHARLHRPTKPPLWILMMWTCFVTRQSKLVYYITTTTRFVGYITIPSNHLIYLWLFIVVPNLALIFLLTKFVWFLSIHLWIQLSI